MLPRAEQHIEEPGTQESAPQDALVHHHFPEGKNSNMSNRNAIEQWLPPVLLSA